jgi:hypothetical protein
MEKEITVKITLENEEREVVFTNSDYAMQNGFYHYESEKIFAVVIGRGKKVHADTLSLTHFESEERLRKCGWSKKDIVAVDDNGGFFTIKYIVSIRNRDARVIGWADRYANTDFATKQNYYGSIKTSA